MTVPTYREELRRSRELNSYQRDRVDALLEFLPFNRSPVERLVINLTSPQQFSLGPGFWVYVKKGCGHELVDITFKGQRDATAGGTERFGIATGEFFPWPFVDAIVNVPTGLSAGSTVTLWVARFPVPAPNVVDVAQLHNRTSFATAQKNVAAPGTAEQISASVILPQGYAVVMKAKHTNTGLIRFGNSKANAENAAVGFHLEARDKIRLSIEDVSGIWIDATVSGEGVEFFYEAV